MKSITRTVHQAGVIAGAAMLLAAMSALPMARHALAQDASAPEVSAGAESPDALPVNVQGSWSGSITDDSMGAGTISLSIKQQNKKLTGGWTVTFNSSKVLGGIEKFSRCTFDEKGVPVVILKLGSASFNKEDCHIQFKSTIASGTQIQGNYEWAECGQQFNDDKGGNINITPTPAP